jgi:hypothetical protein
MRSDIPTWSENRTAARLTSGQAGAQRAAPLPSSDAFATVLRIATFASGFDEQAQAAESFVPLFRDLLEIVARFVEAALAQLPEAFASAPRAVDEARAFHHTQVLGDGLAADVEFRGQPGDGHRVIAHADATANATADGIANPAANSIARAIARGPHA